MKTRLASIALLAASACAHTSRTANEQDPRFIAAANLLGCHPNEVKLSNTQREPHVFRAEGCGRVATFAQMCRNPGPYEAAYVQSMPPPPSVAKLEQNYSVSRFFGSTGDQVLAAWFMQSGRSREIKYGQGWADARMRDIANPPQPPFIPAEQVVLMPGFWMATNCGTQTLPTVFGRVATQPSAQAPVREASTPYDDPATASADAEAAR